MNETIKDLQHFLANYSNEIKVYRYKAINKSKDNNVDVVVNDTPKIVLADNVTHVTGAIVQITINIDYDYITEFDKYDYLAYIGKEYAILQLSQELLDNVLKIDFGVVIG
jgi:hypothetical protein